MKYNKQIMTEIHKLNYIQTENSIFARDELFDQIDADIHYSESILGADIKKDDQGFIYIKDENGNKSDSFKPGKLNEWSKGNNGIGQGITVKAPTKFIIIAGETTYTMPENYKPVSPTDTIRLTGINSVIFKITTSMYANSNNPDDVLQSMVVNPPIALNSLPNGDRDYLVIDSHSRRAYVIVKVGELILTGNESWEIATLGGAPIANPDNKDFRYVYSLPYDFGIYDLAGQSLLCSHFTASSPNSIRFGSNIVSTARDGVDDRGFMINIDAECLKDGRGYIENFKSYLRACYKSNNPVRILYKLKENRVKPIQLDEYALNTQFLNTYVYTNYPSNVAFGVPTIGEWA